MKSGESELVNVDCPYCRSSLSRRWATERGFDLRRCEECDFLFVSPRPPPEAVAMGVGTGLKGEADNLDISERRVASKISRYRRILAGMFADVWQMGKPIDWVDVGAGYGEFLEAVQSLSPEGSRITGVEPMLKKAQAAQRRGLTVRNSYLKPDVDQADFISLIDVFSHIPDFDMLMDNMRRSLRKNGTILIETGNLADVQDRADFFGELGLPDHIVFAGEKHMRGYIDRHGFDVVSVERERIDGISCTAKNIVKKFLGRPVSMRLPYTSQYRSLIFRAVKR